MALEHTLDTPLAKAVVEAKSQSAFARLIGRSQSYVHGLLRDGKDLRPKEAQIVEKAYGIPKEDLCPEAYPRDPAPAPAPAPDGRFEHVR